MKQYVAQHHLRIVGKGWEVRHQLRKLAVWGEGTSRLIDYLEASPPVRLKLGASSMDRNPFGGHISFAPPAG